MLRPSNDPRTRLPLARQRAPLVLLALLLVTCTLGCSRWNWRGQGFGDDSGNFASKMRPPADERQFSGFDSRAREVERDLGVR